MLLAFKSIFKRNIFGIVYQMQFNISIKIPTTYSEKLTTSTLSILMLLIFCFAMTYLTIITTVKPVWNDFRDKDEPVKIVSVKLF